MSANGRRPRALPAQFKACLQQANPANSNNALDATMDGDRPVGHEASIAPLR